MFKTLIATCLLTFSSCTGIKQESKDLPKKNHVYSALNQNGAINCLGGFNFRDHPDYSVVGSELQTYTFVFEDSSQRGANYVSYISDSVGSSAYSCDSLTIQVLGGSNDYVIVSFHVYNGGGATTLTQSFQIGRDLSNSYGNYKDSILGFNQPYTFSGDNAVIFDAFFTSSDNAYTTTYNGYYNFTNGITAINTYFGLTGSISFDTSLYKLLTNRNNGALGGYSTLLLLNYNVENSLYTYSSYTLPDGLYSIYTKNVMFNNVKMTVTTYNVLSSYGTFSYVRDNTYDDTTFGDMLFGIADTPVYFISRLLNFELFGFNLFIAFTSLLTLCIVIVCIRKFF